MALVITMIRQIVFLADLFALGSVLQGSIVQVYRVPTHCNRMNNLSTLPSGCFPSQCNTIEVI